MERHLKKISRLAIAEYPLRTALKQIEAWRRADDSGRAVLPPSTVLTEDQATRLRKSLEASEPAAGAQIAHATV